MTNLKLIWENIETSFLSDLDENAEGKILSFDFEGVSWDAQFRTDLEKMILLSDEGHCFVKKSLDIEDFESILNKICSGSLKLENLANLGWETE